MSLKEKIFINNPAFLQISNLYFRLLFQNCNRNKINFEKPYIRNIITIALFLKNIVLKISYGIGKSFSLILGIFNINNFNIFIRKEAIPNL